MKSSRTLWQPEQDLANMLDALTAELLAAPSDELPGRDPSVARSAVAAAMRGLIAAADAGVFAPPGASPAGLDKGAGCSRPMKIC